MSTLEVVVATIGKAHGLRGEVALVLRTDQPEERFRAGTIFRVDGPEGERALTVAGTRAQQGRWYVRFTEVTDRTDAESLRGAELSTQVDADQEAWYPSQLKGLTVRHVDGHDLGTVHGIEHYPAQDLLIVRTRDRGLVQLPLVHELVPELDLEAGTVLADPPGGLFDTVDDDDTDDDGTDGAREG